MGDHFHVNCQYCKLLVPYRSLRPVTAFFNGRRNVLEVCQACKARLGGVPR